jgi:hypothetical protein
MKVKAEFDHCIWWFVAYDDNQGIRLYLEKIKNMGAKYICLRIGE